MATARPWPKPENDIGLCDDDDGFWELYVIPGIGRFDEEEDAKLAVRAVNSFDALLEACKAALSIANAAFDEGRAAHLPGHRDSTGTSSEEYRAAYAEIENKIRAAIAAATQ